MGAPFAFDNAAIMRAAHVAARAKLAALRADGITTWTYALAFRHALRGAWGDARTARWWAEQDAKRRSEDARERAIADLEHLRLCAQMSDNFAVTVRETAAIDARLLELRTA